MIIVEEEAKVVRRIFREYLKGLSLRDIVDVLEKDGIKNGAGSLTWHTSNIKGILKNEKYIGDALLQKTITIDFINRVRIKNDGTEPQYYVKDDHAPIIPRDIFVNVQEEMIRRANLVSGENGKKKRVYSGKYALSGLCICSKCKDFYRRITWTNRGVHSVVWRCCTRLDHGPKACDASTVRETELQDVAVKAINMILKTPDDILDKLMKNIKHVLAFENAKAEQEEGKDRMKEIENFLTSESKELLEYDESLVRKYIKSIEIYEDRFNVTFKSGISVNINRI